MIEARRPVLIDTDIGDDVDDAFALALALTLPGLDVIGVTTVSGPVEQRAALAHYVLAAADRADVPVAAGCSGTRTGRPGPNRFSHGPVLKHTANQAAGSAAGSAIDLIVAAAHAYAPLTLIALGPLTNIAAALDRDPALAQRARLVAIAGTLGFPYPDWNLRCDPPAARRVLASGMPITLVGMHVTLGTKMSAAQVQRLFASRSRLAGVLGRCVLAWRTWKRRLPFLHDVLAVAVTADPTIVRLVPRRVMVGWRGFSRASPRGRANALVCREIDQARVRSLLETQLLGGEVEPAARGFWQRIGERLA